jgi:hypothetical protein
MPIKVKFNEAALREYLDKAKEDAIINVIKAIDSAFKAAVIHAKNIPPDIGFSDQTGNLRGSIGYVLFQDGKEINSFFSGAGEGVKTGKSLADRIAQSNAGEGVIIGVLVAGMNYAVYVEAMGRDVLTSASFKLLPEFKKNIAIIGEGYGLKLKLL